jgi:hypothetical protein
LIRRGKLCGREHVIKRHVFGHHKCGTIWINTILKSMFDPVSVSIGLRVFYAKGYQLHFHSNTVEGSLPKDELGVHIIRDPRDLAVSAYFSHLKTHGLWPELVGHRKLLSSLSHEEGLLADIKWSAEMPHIKGSIKVFDSLSAYSGHENVLAIGFEKFQSEPFSAWRMLFDFLGIDVSDRALKELLEEYSFNNMSGRKKGQVNNNSHMRKGVSGDWVNHFNPEIKEYFKTRWGKLLIDLGYEENLDW